MWVSARGDVETYASDALQPKLEDWFVTGGIGDEAREIVKGHNHGAAGVGMVFEESEDEDERDGGDVGDVFSLTPPTMDKGKKKLRPLNTTMANAHFLRSQGTGEDGPRSAPLFSTHPFTTSTGSDAPGTSTPLLLAPSTRSIPLPSTPTPLYPLTLKDTATRTAFYTLRFTQLQQSVCKTVAKAWIKIIEPKKQTRFPYNLGDAGKPTWWPASVRHKEPDHLMKPERHELLLTILRSERVKVSRLQLATAEVVALIKGDGKMGFLMDVYRVAREEERIREEGKEGDGEQEVRVEVSTLDGWEGAELRGSREGSEEKEKEEKKDTRGEKRKRASVPTISSGATTTSTRQTKRRRSLAAATTTTLEQNLGNFPPPSFFHPDPNTATIGLGLLHPQPPCEPMARAHSFSSCAAGIPMSTTSSSITSSESSSSPWLHQNYTFTNANPAFDPTNAFYYPPAQQVYDPNQAMQFDASWNFALDISSANAIPDLSSGGWSGEASFEAQSPSGGELRLNLGVGEGGHVKQNDPIHPHPAFEQHQGQLWHAWPHPQPHHHQHQQQQQQHHS